MEHRLAADARAELEAQEGWRNRICQASAAVGEHVPTVVRHVVEGRLSRSDVLELEGLRHGLDAVAGRRRWLRFLDRKNIVGVRELIDHSRTKTKSVVIGEVLYCRYENKSGSFEFRMGAVAPWERLGASVWS